MLLCSTILLAWLPLGKGSPPPVSAMFQNDFAHDVQLLWVNPKTGARVAQGTIKAGTMLGRQVGWGHQFMAALADGEAADARIIWQGTAPLHTSGNAEIHFHIAKPKLPPQVEGALRITFKLSTKTAAGRLNCTSCIASYRKVRRRRRFKAG